VVTDIDGTLTDGHRHLDFEAASLLRTLERDGTRVILATGNVLPVALAVHRSIGLSGPIVAENGGLLYRRQGSSEEVTARSYFSLKMSANIF
jgi:hydroxymethylpyrimidine pyrophosphatase-like HAD family hydrolase